MGVWVLFLRAPAVGADADDPQEVLRDLEPVFRGHRVLERLEFSGEKLDDLSAFGTDHVIVVLMFVVVLVMSAPVAKPDLDRKSTRLNSSHSQISYAVFCLKKKKHTIYLSAASATTTITSHS